MMSEELAISICNPKIKDKLMPVSLDQANPTQASLKGT